MKATIVGVLKGKTKTGREFMNIYATKDFSQYEQENNVTDGVFAFTEFTYNAFDVYPGDVVDFVYEPGFQGRASLVDIVPIKLAAQSAPSPTGKETK